MRNRAVASEATTAKTVGPRLRFTQLLGCDMSTVMQASQLAKEWCERNPKWQRICDIEDSDGLMLQWSEIPSRDKKFWIQRYGDSAESAWREFSSRHPCRKRFGHIGDDGQFYDCVTHKPPMMNSMMVFETGGKSGIYYRGGMSEKSCLAKCDSSS